MYFNVICIVYPILFIKCAFRRRSTRLTSLQEDDPLAVDYNNKTDESAPAIQKQQRKRLGITENNTPTADIYHTPSKKSKETAGGDATPARRKSILKSATTRMGKHILIAMY